jgi:hypothetical protein
LSRNMDCRMDGRLLYALDFESVSDIYLEQSLICPGGGIWTSG